MSSQEPNKNSKNGGGHDDGVMTVYVMRHGKRVKSYDEVGICVLDAPLTERGAAEIHEIRQLKLANIEFEILRTSPVRRAMMTAAIAVPDGKWVEDPRLAFRLPETFDFLWPRREEMPPEVWKKILNDLVLIEAEQVQKVIEEAVFNLRKGQNALIVGHQPAFGKVGALISPSFPQDAWETLPEGTIYKLVFGEDARFLYHEIL